MIDFLEHLEMNQPAVLLINALLCLAIMAICLCRLNAMDHRVMWRVQLEYVVYMGAGFVSMGRPWWGENVGWASLMLETAILVGFLSSTHAWRKRYYLGEVDAAPEIANTDHVPLEVSR